MEALQETQSACYAAATGLVAKYHLEEGQCSQAASEFRKAIAIMAKLKNVDPGLKEKFMDGFREAMQLSQ
jgi:hypothetical protein